MSFLERFDRIGVEFIVRRIKTVSPAGSVFSSGAHDLAVLFMIDKPVFGSFEHGDFVAFQSAAATEDEFTAIYRVFFESLNHFYYPVNAKRILLV